MFLIPQLQPAVVSKVDIPLSHLGLELHLCVGLVQPAVEVRSQKQRLLLLQRQPVPPALLLLPDLDVHLTLGGSMVDLENRKRNRQSGISQQP